MRGIAVPVLADSVEWPIVTYGDGSESINFVQMTLSRTLRCARRNCFSSLMLGRFLQHRVRNIYDYSPRICS
jgi:hypothetical protein